MERYPAALRCRGCNDLACDAFYTSCCRRVICGDCEQNTYTMRCVYISHLPDLCIGEVEYADKSCPACLDPSGGTELGESSNNLRSEIQRYCVKLQREGAPPRMEHADLLEINNSKLLQSGKYSDLTVRCGDDVYHLHRSVVCRVEFFAASCDGGFKVCTIERELVLSLTGGLGGHNRSH